MNTEENYYPQRIPRTLITESPVMYLNRTAQVLGSNEAQVLQLIHHLAENPYSDGTPEGDVSTRKYQGAQWVRIPPRILLNPWTGKLRALSQSSIKRAISNLRKLGVLKTTTVLSRGWDNTNWYSIDEAALKIYDNIYQKHLSQVMEERFIAGRDAQRGMLSEEREQEIYQLMKQELKEAKEALQRHG